MSKALTVSILLLVNLLVVAAGFSTVYDDAYARWMIKVNGAAYSKNPAACLKNIKELASGDWQVVKVHETECSPVPFLSSYCQYIILKSVANKQYIIAFRGTVGNDQLIEQFLNKDAVKFENYGKVNDYFQKAFKELWPSVQATVSNAKKDGYSVVVTGFSLGGALATITALKVVDSGYSASESTYLLTFGSPRVGNDKFAAAVERALMYRHRVVNKADLVPHIPPCLVSFQCF
jgi:predicted lipase